MKIQFCYFVVYFNGVRLSRITLIFISFLNINLCYYFSNDVNLQCSLIRRETIHPMQCWLSNWCRDRLPAVGWSEKISKFTEIFLEPKQFNAIILFSNTQTHHTHKNKGCFSNLRWRWREITRPGQKFKWRDLFHKTVNKYISSKQKTELENHIKYCLKQHYSIS